MPSTLVWILASSVAMSVIALVGGLTVLLPEKTRERVISPLVALAAGAMIGGALFHLLPASVEQMGPGRAAYAWVAAGFVTFLALEQFLHWHHCHDSACEHRTTVGYLLLLADGLHNLIGGMAVAAAFLVDIRVGLSAWVAAAAHEIPQELGDFGVLVHSGWSRKRALLYNVLSALTFLVGGIATYALAQRLNVTALIAFGAGNFLYIGAADLVPEISRHHQLRTSLIHFALFAAGLALLWAVAVTVSHDHGM